MQSLINQHLCLWTLEMREHRKVPAGSTNQHTTLSHTHKKLEHRPAGGSNSHQQHKQGGEVILGCSFTLQYQLQADAVRHSNIVCEVCGHPQHIYIQLFCFSVILVCFQCNF